MHDLQHKHTGKGQFCQVQVPQLRGDGDNPVQALQAGQQQVHLPEPQMRVHGAVIVTVIAVML
jgi:hypothetical protein